MKKLLISITAGLTLFSYSLCAQSELPTYYQVEVLVFQNKLPDLEGGELWSAERVDHTIKGLAEGVAPNKTPSDGSPLSRARTRLESEGAYRILAHKFWVQEARPESETHGYAVSDDSQLLSGLVKFYISRYLHVRLDMLLLDLEASGGTGVPEHADRASADSNNATLAYRISERRRVRSDEIYYFDHPKFGVLVSVSPIKSDQ